MYALRYRKKRPALRLFFGSREVVFSGYLHFVVANLPKTPLLRRACGAEVKGAPCAPYTTPAKGTQKSTKNAQTTLHPTAHQGNSRTPRVPSQLIVQIRSPKFSSHLRALPEGAGRRVPHRVREPRHRQPVPGPGVRQPAAGPHRRGAVPPHPCLGRTDMQAGIALWAIFLWAPRLRTITHQLLIAYTAGQPVTPQTHGRRTEAQPRTIDMQGNRKDSQSPRRRKNASVTDPLPLASSTLQAVPISVHKCVQPCRGDHGPR